jgi:hypothetical protein
VTGPKRRTSVHPEDDGAAREAITRSPSEISVWLAAQQRGVPTSTAWRVCYGDSLLLPYKMQLRQPLSEDVLARRYAFPGEYVALLGENPCFLNVTCSPMKHTSTWMIMLTSKLFVGLLFIASHVAPAT